LTSSESLKYRWGIAKSNYVLGRAEIALGNAAEGLDHLAAAARVASAARQPVVLFRVELARAEALAAHGHGGEARRLLEEARSLQERSDSRLWAGLLHLAEGGAAIHSATPEPAAAALALAYETFVQLGAERLRAETLRLQAKAFEQLGNLSAATSAATHARSLHRALGLAPPAVPDSAARGAASDDVGRVLGAATSIARSLATVQGVDALLERVLDVAITHLGCERGVVALVDPLTGRPRVRCARNIDRESVLEGLEISWSAVCNAGSGDEVVHSGDALAEPAFASRDSIRRARIRSLIALPIRYGDRVLGSLYLDHRGLTDLFGPEEREFARFIADVAALGLHNAQELELREEQVRHLRGELEADSLVLPRGFVARNPTLRAAVQRGIRGARAGRILLITGATGTGKDHLARVIHEASGQRGELVDCALPSLSETLFESEIFGVARGAATMVHERPGFVEAARGGTLFLNEIGDLPNTLQPKLLHFLDRREYRRVGASEIRSFEGLVLCATNADLEQKVANGSFREDLFYRLSECVIELPPLRERPDDIAPLAELFLAEIAQRSGRAAMTLHPRAHDLLRRAVWPGNVRELRGAILRASDVVGKDGVVRAEHLDSPSLREVRESWSLSGNVSSNVAADEEVRRIHEALVRAGGIIMRAADMLGLKETTLRRRIKRYRLDHLTLGSPGRPAGRSGANGSANAPRDRRAPTHTGRAKRATPST
jgi:transcriptional regulator with GAF, ATPase, and Fis domain